MLSEHRIYNARLKLEDAMREFQKREVAGNLLKNMG